MTTDNMPSLIDWPLKHALTLEQRRLSNAYAIAYAEQQKASYDKARQDRIMELADEYVRRNAFDDTDWANEARAALEREVRKP